MTYGTDVRDSINHRLFLNDRMIAAEENSENQLRAALDIENADDLKWAAEKVVVKKTLKNEIAQQAASDAAEDAADARYF